jgi:two-component system, chemotaxis family, protein-glutamate methylesterase/glutaminase
MKPIKVLIVDDSALVRRLLSAILRSDPGIEVCAEATDAHAARELIKKHNPDVLTLDVEMPKMDGLTFLSNLMRLRPMPVVMISSLTEKGADVTLEALELGAVDFVAKPKIDLARGLDEAGAAIIEKVRTASRVNPLRLQPKLSGRLEARAAASTGLFRTTDRLVAIGASTGGTEAIRNVLLDFPADAPGTVITQHIPAGYSEAFARRLDKDCAPKVFHAEDGQRVLQGHVYVAPGGKHLSVDRSGAHWFCRVSTGEAVNRHMPSVDVLFQSVARSAGANSIGILLTGMGEDGARGLMDMQMTGALTICQDEATSVVWGMPGAAVRLGAAAKVLPLGNIAATCLSAA